MQGKCKLHSKDHFSKSCPSFSIERNPSTPKAVLLDSVNKDGAAQARKDDEIFLLEIIFAGKFLLSQFTDFLTPKGTTKKTR